MNIEVFCRRKVRMVHAHPDIRMVNKYAAGRPHLAQPHEHQVEITVWANSPGVERMVDLLDLQYRFDESLHFWATRPSRLMHCDQASFEQICERVYSWFDQRHRICRVQVEADGIEGAVIEWGGWKE